MDLFNSQFNSNNNSQSINFGFSQKSNFSDAFNFGQDDENKEEFSQIDEENESEKSKRSKKQREDKEERENQMTYSTLYTNTSAYNFNNGRQSSKKSKAIAKEIENKVSQISQDIDIVSNKHKQINKNQSLNHINNSIPLLNNKQRQISPINNTYKNIGNDKENLIILSTKQQKDSLKELKKQFELRIKIMKEKIEESINKKLSDTSLIIKTFKKEILTKIDLLEYTQMKEIEKCYYENLKFSEIDEKIDHLFKQIVMTIQSISTV